MEQQPPSLYDLILTRRAKRALVIILTVLMAGFAVYLLSSYSFISVRVSNPSDGATQFTLIKDGGEPKIIESDVPSVKKLVRRGEYNVLVEQDNKSFFSVVNAKGFMRTTTIDAELQPERARRFVGNNPSPCMNYIHSQLVSYVCGSRLSELNLHEPANQTTPTYARTNRLATNNSIYGIVDSGDDTFALIRSMREPFSYSLYKIESAKDLLTPNLNSSNIIGLPLSGLSDTYAISSFGGGFVIYNESFSSILYLPSLDSSPEKIAIEAPGDMAAQIFSANKYGITLTYSDYLNSDVDGHGESRYKGKSRVFVYRDGVVAEFSFSGLFGDLQLCEENKLCGITERGMEVYDISESKASLLYRVSGVHAIMQNNFGMALVGDNNVIEFDVNTRTGHVEFSFGEYKLCGAKSTKDGYVLCLINIRNDKVAIYIDQENNNVDDIDKKVAELLRLEISDVSAYGDYIFINPFLGELQYNPRTQSFQYDPVLQAAVNRRLSEAIKRIDFSPRYKIINTSEQ